MNTSTFTAFPDSVTNRSEPATTRGRGLGATDRLTRLMRNGKGGRSSVSWRDLPLFGDFCTHPELPGCDADGAVEVIGELALGREAGAGSELRQEQVTFLQPIRANFNSPKKRRHLDSVARKLTF